MTQSTDKPHHINRLVLNFPGFETTGSVHQIERLTAGSIKTAGLWNFEVERSNIEENPEEHKTDTRFSSAGNGWTATTRYVHFSWADIISEYEDKPYPKSLLVHFPKYLTFFLDGSVLKYSKASRRYWGFTIYPLLLMIVFGLVSYFGMASLLSGVSSIWIILASLTVFLLLCKWPGDRFYVNLSINDWAFARDMCNSENPKIDKRYELFANQIIEEVSQSKPDEILIVGHSFGSVWAVTALAMALEKEPNLFLSKRVTFLALGSSLLKIGLVRRAQFFRDAVAKVLSQKDLVWHDIQTKTDFISFYKSDPFKPMGIAETASEVIVHRVNFKHALTKSRHKKMMKSMYLAHRQYILYCDNRVHHDFQLRVIGPFFADELARNINLTVDSAFVSKKENTK